MILRAVAVVTILAGCVDDDYRCTFDEQCNLGEAGRCELDRRCTAFDDDCPSNRRYTEHSGLVSNACFDDAVAPANPCADGQPPALPTDGCFAAVCEAVPACCETGWSNACVQQAQITCPLQCDTRIAITAIGPTGTELWDVRSVDGATWSANQLVGSGVAWLAPIPGAITPRLARFDAGSLFIDDEAHALTARSYNDMTSVDLDRSGHDTLVLGSTDTTTMPATAVLEILDLTTGVTRELTFDASSRIEWGDYDHDAFPDAVIANSNATYLGAANVEDPQRLRVFAPQARANVSGPITNGQNPAIRSLAWADLDGDHTLDLIVAGNSVRVHVAEQTSTNQPIVTDEFQVTVDCHPATTTGVANCNAGTPPGPEASSFALVGVPRAGGADIVIVAFPQLEAHLIEVTSGPVRSTLTPIPIVCATTCAPIVALVARDLNHDGVLDLIGIDQELGLWTRLSPAAELSLVTQIRPTGVGFTTVRVSVTGGV